jgi:hypothetical protein
MPIPRTFIAASIGFKRRDERVRRGMPARGQLRPPDRRLRLGLTGQAPEELGAGRAGFRFGARQIQVGGALFLGPAFERIGHGTDGQLSARRARPLSSPSHRV